MSKAKEQANIQRAEAKQLLNAAFGWGENISNQAVDRAIDCIISAALLEIAAIQEEAMLPKRKIYNGSNG